MSWTDEQKCCRDTRTTLQCCSTWLSGADSAAPVLSSISGPCRNMKGTPKVHEKMGVCNCKETV